MLYPLRPLSACAFEIFQNHILDHLSGKQFWQEANSSPEISTPRQLALSDYNQIAALEFTLSVSSQNGQSSLLIEYG
jgi:hypothetical protein